MWSVHLLPILVVGIGQMERMIFSKEMWDHTNKQTNKNILLFCLSLFSLGGGMSSNEYQSDLFQSHLSLDSTTEMIAVELSCAMSPMMSMLSTMPC